MAMRTADLPLDALYRLGTAPHLPPAGHFPQTRTEFEQWAWGREEDNSKIDWLLNFYEVHDSQTSLVFPATSVVAGGAPGDAEVFRKHKILEQFLQGLL
jgi:hypothetical protein